MADSFSPADQPGDQADWWRAYVLAQDGQVDELRRLANSGDDHARRQLAGLLADRVETAGAIEAIRPLADAGDDAAERSLARWLADAGSLDELRQRAAAGSWHAACELVPLLARHDLDDELRERASPDDGYLALRALARRLAERGSLDALRELVADVEPGLRPLVIDAAGDGASGGGLEALRLLADWGDRKCQAGLTRRLVREGRRDEVRQRAERGDEYARHWLSESPS
ncbi:MAG TPA: hypothetical protein VHZ33_00860 [Trebonia sp.]|nr:hypothetical protein [Trebonia sp.]